MDEIYLNKDPETVASELEAFYIDQGGTRRLPKLEREPTQSHLVRFSISEGDKASLLTIRPVGDSESVLSIYPNDSVRWGWKLGVSRLGVDTYVAHDIPKRASDFCDKFLEHLDEKGFLSETQLQKQLGGRPRRPDYEWARREIYCKGRDVF